MLIHKELDTKIIKRDTVSATSPTGQKGTEGCLLTRVIKHDLITTHSPAVKQIKKGPHPLKRDQALY